jgi:transcriptional regulator with XRE-family HTH domain
VARQPVDHLTTEGDSLARRLGERLRARRRELGQTLAEVARAADVSVSYLSAVETGTNQPSLPVLVRVVHALDLTIADVLRSEGQNHVRLGRVDDDEPGERTLSHPGLRLSVVAHTADPGASGEAPVLVGDRNLFVVVRRGELVVHVDGERYALRQGDTLDARAPESVSWSAAGGERVSAVWASGAARARSAAGR